MYAMRPTNWTYAGVIVLPGTGPGTWAGVVEIGTCWGSACPAVCEVGACGDGGFELHAPNIATITRLIATTFIRFIISNPLLTSSAAVAGPSVSVFARAASSPALC